MCLGSTFRIGANVLTKEDNMSNPVQTCLRKHYCDRRAHNERQSFPSNSPSYEYKYEVYDLNGEDGEVQVFACNELAELRTHLLTNGFHPSVIGDLVAGKNVGNHKVTVNGVCKICDLYDKRKAEQALGIVSPFYLIVEGISRHYGGPEEGGWWYDWHTILDVRKVFTFKQALKHARELREKYPQPKYNRYSSANRGEDDTVLRIVYSEDDPRWPEESNERPRYE